MSGILLGKVLFLGILVSLSGCEKTHESSVILQTIQSVDKGNLYNYVKAFTDYGTAFSHKMRDYYNPLAGDTTQVFSGLEVNHRIRANKLSYIEKNLRQFGYNPYREDFEYVYLPKIPSIRTLLCGVNIIAEKRGEVYPDVILEIGAHYDAPADSPGADDDISGVAGVLEISRVMSKIKTKKSIRFCFFDLEEMGTQGSNHHVQRILSGDERPSECIFVLEMIGYATGEEKSQKTPIRIPLLFSPPTVGDFVAVIGNLPSGSFGALYEHAVEAYVPDLSYYSINRIGGFIDKGGASDNGSYWRHGMKAIMITDTGKYRYPYKHKATDTIDKLNFDFMHNVVKVMVATALEYAEPVD